MIGLNNYMAFLLSNMIGPVFSANLGINYDS